MFWLKQSTAFTAKIGPFLDDTDGKTAETALTIAQADVRLSKNGGDIAQKNEATSCTHDELGIYGCPLDTTDTGTLGRLQLWVHESGALPVWHEFMVVPANVWDSMFGSDKLQVDATQIEGADATDQINAACDTALADYDGPTNAEMEARTLVAASYFDPAADAVADVTLVATTTTNSDMRGTDNAALASVCTEARLAELAAANLPADVDAILADTNELQTDDIPGAISGLNDPTAAAIADAVWDEISTGHVDAGKAGQQLWTDLDAVLADTNEVQGDDVPGLIAALNDPTAAGIADAVWDELSTGHTDAGKAGQQLWTDLDAVLADTNELQTDDIPGVISGLNDPTAAAIRTEIDNNSTQLAAIVADTGELQTDWADGGRLDLLLDAASAPTVSEIRTEMDDNSTQLAAIVADTNELQTDDIPSLIAALNDIAVTDVTQRQIPDSIPAVSVMPTIEQALYMIAQFLHERAVVDTTVTVRKVDGSTPLLTLTLDDDTDPTSITRAS